MTSGTITFDNALTGAYYGLETTTGGTCYSSAQSLSDLNLNSSEVIYNFPEGYISQTTILNGGAVVVWGGTVDHVMIDSGRKINYS